MIYSDKAPPINPNNLFALNNKGIDLEKLHDLTKSIFYYNKVLVIDPNYGKALNNKKRVQGNLNMLAFFNNKGKIFSSLKKFKRSVYYFNKSLVVDPNNIVALSYIGTNLNYLGKYNISLIYSDGAILRS